MKSSREGAHIMQKATKRYGLLLLGALMAQPLYAQTHSTQGNVDGVSGDGAGAVALRGWACKVGEVLPSARTVELKLYVGGEAGNGGVELGTYTVDQSSEQAINDICRNQYLYNRFAIGLSIAVRQQHGGQRLYVYASTQDPSAPYSLLAGSGQFTVPEAPEVSDSVYYIHTDRLGSNVIMTDNKANVVAKTDYRAYGAAADNQKKSEAPGYTSHYEDPLTGLTYMQQRYYDSDLGRFISTDPVVARVGDVFNFNRYAYAANSPLNFTDPTGMDYCVGRVNGVYAAIGYCGDDPRSLASGPRDSNRGGPAGGPGEGGGSIPTERPVNVTANRPPDIVRQEFFGFTPQDKAFASMFESIYGGWNRFMRLLRDGGLNFSLGVGAAGQVMPDYADVEVGAAMDSNLTFCFYDSVSGGGGLGGIWGAGGVSGGLGTGALSSGPQTSYGTYWTGGEGFAGEGKVAYAPGGGIAYSRAIFGGSVSATGTTISAGAFVNKTTYHCL